MTHVRRALAVALALLAAPFLIAGTVFAASSAWLWSWPSPEQLGEMRDVLRATRDLARAASSVHAVEFAAESRTVERGGRRPEPDVGRES